MPVLAGNKPPYVPWSCGFTKEAKEKLQAHYGTVDVEDALQNHILKLGSDIGFFTTLSENQLRDVFGVVWDRSIDKDIGNVEGRVLPEPSLKHYAFPDPLDPRFFTDIPQPNWKISGALPRFPNWIFAVRACLDDAGDAKLVNGLLRPSRLCP